MSSRLGPRSRGRVDLNQRAIVKALLACGCLVESLSPLGGDVADLLVMRARRYYVLEVKRPGQEPSEGQAAWLLKWHGKVVHDEAEALAAVGFLFRQT